MPVSALQYSYKPWGYHATIRLSILYSYSELLMVVFRLHAAHLGFFLTPQPTRGSLVGK